MPPKLTIFWRLPYRKRQFVRHFLACDMDEVEAARRANWTNPEKAGMRLLRSQQIQDAILEQGRDVNITSAMGPEETRRRMTVLARDDTHPSYFKALEALGRWHGLNIDKLTISQDKQAMLEAISQYITKLNPAEKPEIVEAELIAPKALLEAPTIPSEAPESPSKPLNEPSLAPTPTKEQN